mgnify:CR=1 FL=1
MRKHLLAGNNQLLGENISTVIYGAGKELSAIFKSLRQR